MKLHGQSRGFTLIELLIVTVVIVTLMGVVFRLVGTGGANRNKAITIDRMQRIENALSGYYAAYGCYPPVPLQGRSRNIYLKVNAYGVQLPEQGSKDFEKSTMMAQIIAACRAQPLAASWPASENVNAGLSIDEFCKSCVGEIAGPYGRNFGTLNSASGGLKLDAVNWSAAGGESGDRCIQLFEFGLLSFLFPRYFFMLDGAESEFYDNKDSSTGRRRGQWAANNQLPCKLSDGDPYSSWEQIKEIMGGTSGNAKDDAGMISNLTSQAVCARWMPNFKGIVSTVNYWRYRYFFGVDIMDSDRKYTDVQGPFSPRCDVKNDSGDEGLLWGNRLRVFPSGGGDSGGAHLLMSMTVRDGWGCEFFYYSEPPYQSYRLWSSGENRMTFPPWYDLSQFDGKDRDFIHKFTEDDIVHMSN